MAAKIAKQLRDITKEDAIRSYQELKDNICEKEITMSRKGLKALDYLFLEHRLKTKTRRHISFLEALKDPEIVKLLNNLVVKYKKLNIEDAENNTLLKNQYSVFQLYYGAVNQFRPMIAKYIYCLLKPKYGILDFSAGWGGRCLAAMSMGIPYIGIDSNEELGNTYKKMIDAYEPNANVNILIKKSEEVDFSKYDYDLIFTSPPYFMIEKYKYMPVYTNKEDFLEKFFVPVVKNAWKYLRKSGHMALNMPEEMYLAIKDELPKTPRVKKISMKLHTKHPMNAAIGRTIGTEKGHNELIYVWKKTSRRTRKVGGGQKNNHSSTRRSR